MFVRGPRVRVIWETIAKWAVEGKLGYSVKNSVTPNSASEWPQNEKVYSLHRCAL